MLDFWRQWIKPYTATCFVLGVVLSVLARTCLALLVTAIGWSFFAGGLYVIARMFDKD